MTTLIETTKRQSRLDIRGLVSLLLVLAVITAPLWAGRAELRLLGEFLSFLALAVLWNLLAGYAGLLSVGQQAFVGFGGYSLFVLCTHAGLSPFLALPLTIIAAGALAAVFAPLLFRLDGAYFAIGTWVAAETVMLVFAMIPALGGGAGMSIAAPLVRAIASDKDVREAIIFLLVAGLSLATLFGAYGLLLSRAGLALMAVRDNRLAAASLGIDIWRTRFVTYVIVAALSGGLGAVIFLQKLRISPSAAFSLNDWTVMVIFAVVIGGIGRLEGALVGATLYFLMREMMADLGTVYLIVLGSLAILIMLFSRKGLWGLIEARFGWSLMPTEREPQMTIAAQQTQCHK
ncbi:MAG: branched-chain amino acid ABC transporter permease [Mesorhizobium sp.]|uniref:branched-chain amino acid ABC transporter permease n=1 Tax=Mesorhizobium sp. TaxID=1871066 RepID=UPI000FE6287B|nr:branched-chain amino acid ABC transporter permease [Mesorhizobium sp.]RWI57060.1 MAG: branched-chain amino acid ABC transporter permease [Mesorhizobium sp.]